MRKLANLMAMAVVALAAGCGDDSDDEVLRAECFANEECGNGACFLGTCVDTGAGLGTVDIDVQPRDNSGALRQRLSRVFDVASGSQDLYLAPTIQVVGQVSHVGEPFTGTVRAYSVVDGNCHPTSTDAVLVYDGDVVADQVAIALVPGRYRVVMTPAESMLIRPPLIIPNDGACGIEVSDGTRLDAIYSNDGALVTVRGRLRYSINDSTGVAGAQITVRTSIGGAEHSSATVETAGDGSFAVHLPEGGTVFAADVKGGSNVNVPTVVFNNLTRTGDTVGDLNLGVSALVSVPLTVTDDVGTGVADATVLITGQVGAGTLSLTTATNPSGGATLGLRVGTYNVVVLPKRTATVGLVRTTLAIGEGAAAPTLTLVAPPKADVTGVVYSAAGLPVANARVTFRLRSIKAERDVTATTASDGSYMVAVDTQGPTANDNAAEFEVTVEPASDSREPRFRELVRVDQVWSGHDIGLYDSNFVFGKLLTADGGLLPQAALLFYANLGGDEPVLLGVATSTTAGEFAVPLPSPSFAQ
ncbi:MAG: hypothetical protein ACAI38_15790 [Myxococcota bacterium]